MNIFKYAFIILNLPVVPITPLSISLKTWNLVKNNYRTIEEAIKEYFETKTYRLSVAIHLEYPQHWEWYIHDYLTNVLKQTESMSFEIFIDHNGRERKTKVSYHNVWYVDCHDAFSRLLPIVENVFVQAMGQYMVIMDIAKHLQVEKEIQLIFKTAFKWNIVDIAVATYMGNGTFNLYTYDIFLPQQCRQVVSRQFNVFKFGHFDSDELFPHKLRNFHKCPVNICIRPAAPFFSFNLTEDQKEIAYYEGLEATIIRTMAKVLNFDIRLKHLNGTDLGSVHDNGSVTGPFYWLRQWEVDIVMGYFHNPTRNRYFAAITPYFLTQQVMIIRKRDKVPVDGLWLMEPFHRNVWLMVFLTVVVGLALVSFLHYNLRRSGGFAVHLTWLDMFGLALGTSRSYEFRYFATKYGFIMWSLGFIVICASYGGKLYDAFNRKPVSYPITVSDLINGNYTFILNRFLTRDLIKDLKIPKKQIENNNYPNDDLIYEAMLHDNRNRAVLTSYWQFQTFLAVHNLYGEYDMVSEAIITNQLCAYMRPHSYLLETLNNLLRAFKSVGIFDKWMLDAARDYGILNGIEMESSHEPKTLSLVNVRIIFGGLLVLHVVAFMVFVGEVIVKKMAMKGN